MEFKKLYRYQHKIDEPGILKWCFSVNSIRIIFKQIDLTDIIRKYVGIYFHTSPLNLKIGMHCSRIE